MTTVRAQVRLLALSAHLEPLTQLESQVVGPFHPALRIDAQSLPQGVRVLGLCSTSQASC